MHAKPQYWLHWLCLLPKRGYFLVKLQEHNYPQLHSAV